MIIKILPLKEHNPLYEQSRFLSRRKWKFPRPAAPSSPWMSTRGVSHYKLLNPPPPPLNKVEESDEKLHTQPLMPVHYVHQATVTSLDIVADFIYKKSKLERFEFLLLLLLLLYVACVPAQDDDNVQYARCFCVPPSSSTRHHDVIISKAPWSHVLR